MLGILINAFERRKKIVRLRKQLHMSRKCSNELDMLFLALGVDISEFEVCDMVPSDNPDDAPGYEPDDAVDNECKKMVDKDNYVI